MQLPISHISEIKRYTTVSKNIEFNTLLPSLESAAERVADIISQTVYDKIVSSYSVNVEYKDISPEIKQMQSAISNFGIFEHLVFLQISIDEDGVTTMKGDNRTTAFKYQTDEAKQKFINRAWRSVSNLIDLLKDDTDWKNSEQYQETQKLFITDYKQMRKFFDAESLAYFHYKTRFLQRDLIETYLPTIGMDISEVKAAEDKIKNKFGKALTYGILSESIKIFDTYDLPAPLRSRFINEMNKSKNSDNRSSYLQDDLAEEFSEKVEDLLQDINRFKSVKSDTPNNYTDEISENDKSILL